MKRIGVFTSGGDSPGMNAAIRAAVRVGIHRGLEVYGITSGYAGMIEGLFSPMNLRSVANIIQRGGTILKTARSEEFRTPEGRTRAAQQLKKQQIDGLVCIGGDGSFRGAHLLFEEHGIPSIGVPGTIDNDIPGTEITIGFDTAVNTALDAIDRVRDTAASHDRLFIVEVMGRNSGAIAISVGLAGGAEEILIPECPTEIDKTIVRIQDGIKKGKLSSILVCAEGHKAGGAYQIAEAIKKQAGLKAKVCILGHIQRGGSPTAKDRILASQFGAKAVECLLSGQKNVMVGLNKSEVNFTPFNHIYSNTKPSPTDLISLAHILAH